MKNGKRSYPDRMEPSRFCQEYFLNWGCGRYPGLNMSYKSGGVQCIHTNNVSKQFNFSLAYIRKGIRDCS